MTGLVGNAFAVDNWHDFYQLSIRRNEQKVKKTKERWFSSEHQKWESDNLDVLEGAHLMAETKS